jgi:DNA ligase (NAD+)
MVAGLLGRDEVVKEDLNDIEFKAVCALKDGKYTFIYNNEFFTNYLSEYENIIQQWTNQRDLFPYPIDGIVISFPLEYRDKLGVNDHDPEWSIAIKFVPEEATTTIEDIIWQVGKTGSVTPVGILKPVKLSGATVKRVSLYNAGNVIEKKLGIGAVISIHRAGDIIPEISKLIVPSENEITLPNQCPACGSALEFDGVTLYCTNFSCKAKLIRLLDHHLKLLKIKHVGRATIDSFADQGFTIIDLICFVRQFGNDKEKIEPFGFNHGSRSHEIFLNAFNSIKEIDYSLIPVFLGINNVGKKLAKLVSLFYNGTEVDWKHQERALVDLFTRPETKASINNVVERLESVGIEIIYPIEVSDKKVVRAELTGSPKPRWKTKEEFRAECNVVEASLSDDNCDYLITDDYNSNSGKMVTAKKKGITIITYEDFAKMGI